VPAAKLDVTTADGVMDVAARPGRPVRRPVAAN